MTDADNVEGRVRSLLPSPHQGSHFVAIQLVLAGLDIQDEHLAVVGVSEFLLDLPVIESLATFDDFSAGVAWMGHFGSP